MYTIITLNLIIIALSLVSYYTKKNFLSYGFFLLFIVTGIRNEFGNDYINYLEYFKLVQSGADKGSLGNFEDGWYILNLVFSPLNFEILILIIAAINTYLYYNLIIKYVSIKYYWLACFIYLFSPGIMLTNLSAIRQSISICLFIYSFQYITSRNFLKYFLFNIIGGLMHSSAFLLLSIYFIPYKNKIISKNSPIIILILYFLTYLLGEYLPNFTNSLLVGEFEKYSSYEDIVKISSGYGVAYSTLIFALLLYYYRDKNDDFKIIYLLAAISFLFIPLSLVVPNITRISMYLFPFLIIALPDLISSIKVKIFRISTIFLIIIVTLFNFFQFFYSDIFNQSYFNYYTIFDKIR